MNFDQFIKQVNQVKLSADEKTSIRKSVLNFIYQNPARYSVEQPHLNYKSMVPILLKSLIWLQNRGSTISFRLVGTILLIISVLVGGGVTIGAEKALPGDTLYPVKVGLNEEVRGWLSVSEESKANWEIKRAQRRLEEAETLAEDGSLDLEARGNIEANFEAHADRVKKRIEKFENKKDFHAAVDVSSKFETSLKAHQKILNRLTAESKEEVKKEVRPIHSKVKSGAKAWAKTRKNMESKARGNINIESGDDDSGDNQDDDSDELELENEIKTD